MGKKNDLRPKKLCAEEGFDAYYSELFSSRWESLKSSLQSEKSYVEWKNEGCKGYFIDPASVYAALHLPLKGAKRILDMCAAPGGKTLVIGSLMEKDALLVSNERSFQRRQRLSQVCKDSLPESVASRIKLTSSDGARLCLNAGEVYDRILLDAPCSSERHVLNDRKHLLLWSSSRVKSLAMEQWALISSAYRLLSRGGYLVYSTCALSKSENDGIIKRLVKKFDDMKIVLDGEAMEFSDEYKKFLKTEIRFEPERTECGFHILPDRQNGAGPIWFSVLEKT